MNDRISRLLDGLPKDEAILISKPSNIFYLSGYTGEGFLLLTGDLRAIVTDFRYTEQAQMQSPACSVHEIASGRPHDKVIGELISERGIKRVRYEDDFVTVRAQKALQNELEGVELASLDGAPEKLREVKDESEIALIARACKISSDAFEYICGFIREGVTEKEIARAMEYKMLEMGADGLAFTTIVACGANGSLPHAIPGDRIVKKGQMVTMDYGAKVGGYCADVTRTVAVGKPSDEMKKVYDTVYAAQLAAQSAVKADASCKAIDAIARDMIDAAGYQGRFGHGLGHGVGIDIHEAPGFSARSDRTIVAGNVMTVEPGIYLPGIGGVRIENTVAVTQDGCQCLVPAPRELRIL